MAKKATIKELEERINILAYNINHFKVLIDNIGHALSSYIDYKGDTSEFKNHLENLKNSNKLNENDEK